MKHWLVPLELAEIKNKTATTPPPPSGLLGYQEVGTLGFMPSTAYLYRCPSYLRRDYSADLLSLNCTSNTDQKSGKNDLLLGFFFFF
jgi:hypothetical protein